MDHIRSLLYRHLTGRLTPAERQQLEQWAGDNADRQALLKRLADPDYVSRQLERRTLVSVDRPMADMQQRVSAIRRRRMVRTFSIAAMIAVILGVASTYIIHVGQESEDIPTLAEAPASPKTLEEITPGTTRARLITTSGESVDLSASDTTSMQSRMMLAQNCHVQDTRQLCLDVPRGGEFKIILEDSTEVWLNSESTLSYPEVFSPTERRVRVTGEAYFAVRPDAKRPFYVETDEQVVRVYGTTFNVRAYADDPYIYTTLEHGSISIRRSESPSGEVRMSPGHQALLNREDSKLNMRIVDTQVITGWRNGRFVFEDQPLSVIMRDLARWYDFEYEFDDPSLADIIFMGSIPRYSDFTVAKRILERSGDIELRTADNKIIISHCK